MNRLLKSTRILGAILALFIAVSLAPAQTMRTVSITATIPLNSAASNTMALGSCLPTGIIMSSDWTTSSILVRASLDGTNWHNVYDNYGTLMLVTAAAGSTAGRWIVLPPSDTWGFRYLQLRSTNGSGVDVTQTAARTLKVVCR